MTVVLVDPRRASLVPVEAVALLAGDVQYTEEMPVKVPWSLPASRPCFSGAPDEKAAPVLLSSDPDHPMVKARLAAGEQLICSPGPRPGERLVDAVAVMDTLRASGPWEGEQTHDSLRRYLLEETYELFDAIRSGNLDELREELGDILLQVLFHARIAEEAGQQAFGIDDVADCLVQKLNNRVPAVLAGESISLDAQLAQWEERKALEKTRHSAMDDVPTAQPALALTQKVFERIRAAGLPLDLIPAGLVSIGQELGDDAENTLRTQTLEFMDTVRTVEQNVAASRRGPDVPEVLDSAPLGTVTEAEWRAHWPTHDLPDGDPADEELVDEEPVPVPEPVSAEDDLNVEIEFVDTDASSEDESAEAETAAQDSSVEPQ